VTFRLRRRRLWPLLAAASILAACSDAPPEKKAGPAPTLITVTQATAQDFEYIETTLGTLEAIQDPKVAAEVAGRIVAVNVHTGQAVAAGQLLAEIDAVDLAAQHRADNAEISRLQALVAQPDRLTARQQELLARNFISRNALDDALAQQTALASQLDAAHARAALTANALRKARVIAPLAGVIEEQIASRGDYVKVGDPLFRLVSNQQLRAHLPFPEAAAPRLRAGQKVRLSSPLQPDQPLAGEVEEIRPSVSDAGRALDVIARIDNRDGRLKGGGSVDAAIVLSVQADAVMVPEQAVVLRPAGRVVYAIEDGRARQRIVDIGGKRAGLVEIRRGLKAGETVAVDGAGFLSEGAAVTVRERGKTAAAGSKPERANAGN